MPRRKGHDKKATNRLRGLELVSFNLRMMPKALELISLRSKQAVRRDENLRALLEPVQQEIDELLSWTGEAVAEIEKLL